MKEEDAIQKMCDDAADVTYTDKSKFPGMSYEDGIRAALEWVLEVDDGNPLTGE